MKNTHESLRLASGAQPGAHGRKAALLGEVSREEAAVAERSAGPRRAEALRRVHTAAANSNSN